MSHPHGGGGGECSFQIVYPRRTVQRKREPRLVVLELDIWDYGIQFLFQKDKYQCLRIHGDTILDKTKLSPSRWSFVVKLSLGTMLVP